LFSFHTFSVHDLRQSCPRFRGPASEKNAIDGEIKRVSERVDEWLDLTEKIFHFAAYAGVWFEKGDYETKTRVLSALGQNFTLMDGKLSISLQEPFEILKLGLENPVLEKARLEPTILGLPQSKNSSCEAVLANWSGRAESNRRLQLGRLT
jgi:hypothetical protein